MSQNQPILVLLCYARSGGTIFSRTLSCLPNVLLVSEVNPVLNAKGNMAHQVEKWYGLKLPNGNFAENAKAIFGHCNSADLRFVVRDFSFINFTPHQLNNFSPATQFSTLKGISEVAPVLPFAFVRNSYDVWISRDCPPQFSAYYLDYVKALLAAKILIFKYEDFTNNPEKVLRVFCEKSGLKFSAEAIQLSFGNQKITGDVDLANPSRGNNQQEIKPLKRKILPRFLVRRAEADLNLQEANRLLGYPTKFREADFEKAPRFFTLEAKWFVKRLLKRWPSENY